LETLAASIREHGILQPLVVSAASNDRFELIAGERRLRASKLANLSSVPVIVRSFSEQQKLELALIENLQRAELNPIETAEAYRKLGTEFNLSLEQISQRTGQAKSTVSNTMRLLQLPPEARRAVAEGQISEAHGRTLLAVQDPQRQAELLAGIVNQGWTVRQSEEFARQAKADAPAGPAKAGRPSNRAVVDNPAVQRLSHYLGTKVSLQPRSKGGRLVIEYGSDDELQRLISGIAPDNAAPTQN
jgi:ParB family chromosome partitioning protein